MFRKDKKDDAALTPEEQLALADRQDEEVIRLKGQADYHRSQGEKHKLEDEIKKLVLETAELGAKLKAQAKLIIREKTTEINLQNEAKLKAEQIKAKRKALSSDDPTSEATSQPVIERPGMTPLQEVGYSRRGLV